ncbi:2-oxoglutarate (2OG) and Fe(II)-dependent oxygenase superfamily protein [Striga hermonthica]|uniref:2-oxoglutarate (2OG) and Fe(II)-dependent oxygenase superfamily protein n=1 Tax=Striga hermonthica TaxID=68872 RepID=A0A9N7P4U1_STRHE|nr:2-oxoglutarate (2OG) and Fe(II)-dependent oxygenase superfamily protein [Striga hermonthica]
MANSKEFIKIPIFDLSTKTLNPTSASWLADCKKVRRALEEYGFFLAQYKDVSYELDRQVFLVLKELFDLPLETKTRNTSDLVFYGYVGQLPHAPLHESMGIPEATTIDAVQSFTNLMWPSSGNKSFCESIHSYAKLVSELEKKVDRMVFESYGAQRHYDNHIGSTTYLLRTIKYLPPHANNEGNNVGTNVHTDKSFLSILHQNQVNGLQVQLRNGEWFSVDVPTGAFVVMAGDAYEAWSNGRIFAAKHQVFMKGDQPRYCLALFSFNRGTTYIPEELVDSDHPLQYKAFDNFGLARFYLSGATQMTESTAKAYCGVPI